jgi:hypothetical protein
LPSGEPIWHKRGFRQGDPLSLQLFVLAVDVISKLIRHAISTGILQPLHPCRHIPAISLYADDVVLFCHPSSDDIAAVKGMLQLFGSASSLQVTYGKSSASLLHYDDDDAAPLAEHLACPVVELPITYLGIPLSTQRLTAAKLQPMVASPSSKLCSAPSHCTSSSFTCRQRKHSSSSPGSSVDFFGLAAPMPMVANAT